MEYPNPDLLALIKINASVEQYRAAIRPWAAWDLKAALFDDRYLDYWRLIPLYLYARCPFCQRMVQETIDTYTLLLWIPVIDLQSTAFVLTKRPLPAPCEHFMGVHRFVNLHDRLPDEMPTFHNLTGELPYVTPWFFAVDIKTFAVLHALPICRIEGDKFIPSYTASFLTYFSENQKEIWRRHKAEEAKLVTGTNDFHGSTIQAPNSGDYYYDLPGWADRGALGWLNYQEPALPLRFGTGAELPPLYQNMTGRRRPYGWSHGKMSRHYDAG